MQPARLLTPFPRAERAYRGTKSYNYMEKAFFILILGFSLIIIVYPLVIVLEKYLNQTKYGRCTEKESEDIEIHIEEDTYCVTIPKSTLIINF